MNLSDHIRTSDPGLMSLARSVDREMADERTAWIAELRAKGVKAAHPDDGWVDREASVLTLVYPQFNDGVSPGDLVALGWPPGSFKCKTRLVRLTMSARRFWDEKSWHFEAA